MRTAVIGGSPAGCAAAYTLRKQGHDVAVFEAQDHVGGRTSQVMCGGFNLGSGALFLMGGVEAAIFSGELAANRLSRGDRGSAERRVEQPRRQPEWA
jgi:phytoene dehydrogenase-like protein